jgi:hypothetical protein
LNKIKKLKNLFAELNSIIIYPNQNINFLKTKYKNEVKMLNEVINDCPICLTEIEGNHNRVVTECGHAFHCSCLMQNVAHNGFACPYCRFAMANLVEEDEDDDDDDDDYIRDDMSSERDDDSVSVAGPGLEAHLLRGMRWMFQRVEEDDDAESVWETDSESDQESVASLEVASLEVASLEVASLEVEVESDLSELTQVIPVNYQINFSSQRRSRWMEQRDHWRTE